MNLASRVAVASVLLAACGCSGQSAAGLFSSSSPSTGGASEAGTLATDSGGASSAVAGSGGASADVAGSGGASSDVAGSGGTSSGGAGAGGAGSGGTSNPSVAGSSNSTAGATNSDQTGSPEVCDGIDDDNDGVVDDLDMAGDGVCDCLLLATLGLKGTWGLGDVFGTWLASRSVSGATDLADQVLTPELLAKYQVIVAEDVSNNHVYAASEVAALSDWINQGGGFMTLIGYADPGEADNANRLLGPAGMSYGAVPILGGTGALTLPIRAWTPHPVDLGVTAVGASHGYEAQGLGVAFATSGAFVVGRAQVFGSGHVVMWGDEWISYAGEWPSHPEYQTELFWLDAIKWLTAPGQCQVPIPPP